MIELAGYVASILATGTFIPQVIKTYQTQSARDLSMTMLLLSLLGNFCWLINGLGTGNNPLIFSATAISILMVPLIYFKLKEAGFKKVIPEVEVL